jgi:L-threonylcarbamoyladenylate synthase
MELLTPSQLERAAQLLKRGELVAFPTETVYGLGACIFNPDAILAIFKVKGRPQDNPLIVHVSSLEQIDAIAEAIPEDFYRLATHFFPGPLAVILKRRSLVPSIVSAGLDTIAVRMPSHPVALQLIRQVDEPVVAPSANLSGKPSATLATHVIQDFEGRIAAVIDGGATQYGLESTVIGLHEDVPVLLRPGVITREQVEAVLKRPLQTLTSSCSGAAVPSPGMKYRHYCPRTPIRVFYSRPDLEHYLGQFPSGQKRMLLTSSGIHPVPSGVGCFPLTAKEFYALLRLADERNDLEILIYCDAPVLGNEALMNRLLRAAAGH